MKRKCLSFVMCLVFLVSICPGMINASGLYDQEVLSAPSLQDGIDATELVVNGSFEIPTSTTSLLGWNNIVCTAPNQTLGGDYAYLTSDAQSGGNAVAFASAPDQYVHVLQSMAAVPGKTYELSAWAKRKSNPCNAFISISFFARNESMQEEETGSRLNLTFSDTAINSWESKIVSFTMPENIIRIVMMVRLMGEGEVLFDDVSLLEEGYIEPEQNVVKKPPVKPIDYELITNGSFEQSVNPKNDWYAYGGTSGGMDGKYVSVTNEDAQTGSKSLKIEVYGEGGNIYPWVYQSIPNMVPGAEYQVSFFLKSPGVNAIDFAFSFEFNRSATPHPNQWMNASIYSHKILTQSNEWQEVVVQARVPDGGLSGLVRLRAFSDSTVGAFYVDDASLYMTEEPEYTKLETDEIFYYTEWPEGRATVTQYDYFTDLDGGGVYFEMLDGETVLYSKDVELKEKSASFSFKTALMSVVGKEYTIRATMFDALGRERQVSERPVYRYDRPTYLGADGVFRKNGREYNIVLGNGTNMEILPKAPAGGITVVQLIQDANIPILQRMDEANEKGLLVMISLYSDFESAGHPNRIEGSKNIVNMVKNHPALFCYKIQDEPIGRNMSDEELIAAYKVVRDNDPHHPVYTDDSSYGTFKRLGWFCDIMDIDTYPTNIANQASYISQMMEYAVEAVRGRKPVTLLQQAFVYHGYLPTADEFRHYAYQAFFSGASGFGYHTLNHEGSGTYFVDRPEWQGICDWAEWELGFMFDCFVRQKYPMMNEYADANVQWRTYVKDGEVYAMLMNRQSKTGNNVSVPLVDFDSTISVKGYSASRVAGGSAAVVNGSDTLEVTLPPFAMYLYKITPDDTVDFSGLQTTKYRDLIDYPWARSSIGELEKKGIINEISQTKYGPGLIITRGDFAMFLIRTLELTAAATDSFSDVDPDAYYAKEIAVGKALGILSGTGGNLFNPEGEITRQELMAITARGMRLKKALDDGADHGVLDDFSDWDIVAEYAMLDIAAMIRLNIVKGNADGTLNPHGNATRAEAAVIMRRVNAWSGGT